MKRGDDDLRVRPGRIRDGGRGASRPKSFVAQVMRAAKKAGHTGSAFGRARGGSGSRFGRAAELRSLFLYDLPAGASSS